MKFLKNTILEIIHLEKIQRLVREGYASHLNRGVEIGSPLNIKEHKNIHFLEKYIKKMYHLTIIPSLDINKR